jgi:hypothetical protein
MFTVEHGRAHACTFNLTDTLQWVATCACGDSWTGPDYASVDMQWRTHLRANKDTERTNA